MFGIKLFCNFFGTREDHMPNLVTLLVHSNRILRLVHMSNLVYIFFFERTFYLLYIKYLKFTYILW